MNSSQFQALNRTLKSGNISEFIILVDKFTENRPSCLIDSENYDKFRTSLKRTYYGALSECLANMNLMSLVSYLTFLTANLLIPQYAPYIHQLIAVVPASILNYLFNSSWTFKENNT